ncbi:hypothetical protein L7F22_011438 [Adiantum nelumboides]|nr:hypothetical protein [Adiantum nelumboides]
MQPLRGTFSPTWPTLRGISTSSADDALLTYLNDDGQNIEPEWYMPTVPLVLLNGSEGIGTGWSSNVPNYNPKDVLANLRDDWLARSMCRCTRVPGLTGTITPEDANKNRFKCAGIYRQIDEKTWEITELPIKTWTSPYKEALEERIAGDREGASDDQRIQGIPHRH